MIRVQEAVFDPGQELNDFSASVTGVGAVVSFTGIVRDVAGGLEVMQVEHYPGMTEKALEAIQAEAIERWALADALVIHRFGALKAEDVIMMVATSSTHRENAFEAASFLMDYLKSRAPFWKKEVTMTGSDWVEAKASDEAALFRW